MYISYSTSFVQVFLIQTKRIARVGQHDGSRYRAPPNNGLMSRKCLRMQGTTMAYIVTFTGDFNKCQELLRRNECA